jgi:hypothetical protein
MAVERKRWSTPLAISLGFGLLIVLEAVPRGEWSRVLGQLAAWNACFHVVGGIGRFSNTPPCDQKA